MASLKYIPLKLDYLDSIGDLPPDQIGMLVLAALRYAKTGEVPSLPADLSMAFRFIRTDVDSAQANYDELCETNRRNRNSSRRNDGQRPSTTVDDGHDGQRPSTTVDHGDHINEWNVSECNEERNYSEHSMHADGQQVDSPGRGPSLEEVRSFVRQSGLNVDPDDYHEKRVRSGWRNKNGRYVGGDWQKDVRRWASYQKEPVKARTEPSKPQETSFDTDDFFDAALMRTYGENWQFFKEGSDG